MTARGGLGARGWELEPAWRGALSGFSSKAHFLETERDSHAGVFGCC